MRYLSTMSRGAAAVCAAGLLSLGFATTASAEPEPEWPTGSTANQPETWEAFLTEEFGIENADCVKLHDEGLDTSEWEADADYLLVALKAGSAQSSDGDPHTVYLDVLEGDVLDTEDGKDISHIIACNGDVPDDETETPEPTPTKPGEPTGPVVETDIVESSNTAPAVLGGAAALAGLGVAGAMLRRKGQH